MEIREVTGIESNGMNTFSIGIEGVDQKRIEDRINALIKARKASHQKAFLVSWTGLKVPFGAIIDGHQVAWTQFGVVTDTMNVFFATYERLLECGGEKRDEHAILVFLNNEKVD